jgi:hypothetical protein
VSTTSHSSLAYGIRCLVVGAMLLCTGALAAEGMSAVPTSEPAPSLVALALAYEHGEGVLVDPLRAAQLP